MQAELALTAEMGCPDPSRLHGLPGPLQRRPYQPLARAAQQSDARRLQDGSVHDHHGHHSGRRQPLYVDAPGKLLWKTADHARRHTDNDPGWNRIWSLERFQRLTRDPCVMWFRLRGDDVRWDGLRE